MKLGRHRLWKAAKVPRRDVVEGLGMNCFRIKKMDCGCKRTKSVLGYGTFIGGKLKNSPGILKGVKDM